MFSFKEHLKKSGISQVEVAKRTQRTPQYINKLLDNLDSQDWGNVRLRSFIAVCEAIGLNPTKTLKKIVNK